MVGRVHVSIMVGRVHADLGGGGIRHDDDTLAAAPSTSCRRSWYVTLAATVGSASLLGLTLLHPSFRIQSARWAYS
jgi:hypothetical protein